MSHLRKFIQVSLSILLVLFFANRVSAQTPNTVQRAVRDFVLLSGSNSPGTTLIGSSITINGGSVGAYKMVQTTGNATINSNIYSADKITLTNSNVVKGDLSAAANYPGPPITSGTILSIGSSASITGKADVFGSVVWGGGTISGNLTIPPSATYTGPNLGSKLVKGTPTLQLLPQLPQPFVINNVTYPVITTTTTANATYGPGNYGNISYSGNKTLKLVKPGLYIFNSIKMTGNSNILTFDFDNTAGNYVIYVRVNADWGKISTTTAHGGDASRIYLEVQGNGSGTSIPGNSFIISNGSSGGGSKWMGTVYAPNGGINIGSGTGSSSLTGAFWSRSAVSLQSGVTVTYAPFTPCVPPNVVAGIGAGQAFTAIDSIPLDFTGHTTLSAQSSSSGASFTWQASKGGKITSTNTNSATIEVEAAGDYIVSAYTDDPNCVSKDTVVVTAKTRNIIGGELLSIYQNYDPNGDNPDLDSFFVTKDGYVTIDVICKVDTQTVRQLLDDVPEYGLRNILPNGLSKHTITGEFPIVNLLKLNQLQDLLSFCKPYYSPYVGGGLVTSQGDTTIRTYLARKGYDLDGTGVKIGVISDSYGTITDPVKTYSDPCVGLNQTLIVNTAPIDLSEGDVGNVTVVQDFPAKRTDEGRAMMQIVQDLAPGAQKFFNTGVYTAGHLAKVIEDLASIYECQSIVDDVSYPDQPMLKEGVVAKSVNKVKSQGVFYSTSAGNFGRQSYEKIFNGVDATSIGFPGKKAHNFGSNNSSPDFFQRVMLKPGTTFIAFQWLDNNFSQDEGGTTIDLDIYLTPADKTDGTGLIGFNRDNIGGDALEFIPIKIPGNGACDTEAKPYNILIVNNSATNPGTIKYVVFKGGYQATEYNEGNSTIVGHANADGAFTVGAVRFNHVPGHPLLPASMSGITFPQIESFSSLGGTGDKQKPDAAGVDGVDVTVLMGQDYPNQALNSFSNFFGTSAAAPHVAAGAALIIQAREKFLKQPTSPDQLKSLLQSTAVPMRAAGSPGYDFSAGAGLIDVDAAIRTFAVPKPFEISLVKPTNVIPCQDPFVLTIVGENFSTNTKVYVVEGPGDTTKLTPSYISPKRDTLKVTISSCVGNPEIIAFTPSTVRVPPVEDGAPDGGFSNAIKLFSKEIVVQTQNVTKKYGQANPLPATTITVDGVAIELTNLTRADVGLDASKLNLIETNATTNSDVGTYAIKVYRTFDSNNPTDVTLTNQYRYIFKSGLITINKMPIKVTPNDITATYGNYIGEITFKYEFPQDQPANPLALKDTAKKYHEAFLPKNALALIKDFKKQQANGSILTEADLNNLGTLVSFNALKNSRRFNIVNNKLVPETDPTNPSLNSQYIVDVASESFYDFRQDPTLAKFYTGYPGISKKAVLGEVPIDNYEGEVQVTNGGISSLKPLISGYPTLVLNGTGITRLAPMISGQLITILDGQLATLNSNGELVPTAGSPQIQYLNGTGRLMYLISGQVTYVPDGSYVIIPNLAAGLHVISGTRLNYLISGVEYPVISTEDVSTNASGELINRLSLQPLISGSVLTLGGRLGLATLISGTGISRLSPLISGTGIKSLSPLISQIQIVVTNGGITKLAPLISSEPGEGGGAPSNNAAVIFDETDVNEATNNYLGALFGINTITGLDVGVQTVVPGKFITTNFDVTYATGKATIQSDACLLTHGTFKVFGNTTTAPTSLWLNVTTKVSGQLSQKDDYLLFKGGNVTFNFVNSNPVITNVDIPDGKIIADNVSAPITSFDSVNNIWITRVPLGFASTSDIFTTGAKINSSNGFVKTSNNTSSVLKGRFYSNRTFSDQWAYAIAAYQPQFWYSQIDDPGAVVSINGTYKAGTPQPLISFLVEGGSGGGGNNYTGSKSSYDNFTACPESANAQAASRPLPITTVVNETPEQKLKGMVKIYPNPATNHILVSFVPEQSGNSKIMVYTIDGRKVFEVNNGRTEQGMLYLKSVDVGKLTKGVYMLQLWSGNKVTVKKIFIN